MRETLSSEISPHTIATARWWQDHSSVFKSLDDSLCLVENIEELEGVEQRRYLSIDGGTDLSRAEFESWGIEIGLELNPPPDVEPFEHFCYELRKDQEENNPDYRPGGLEIATAKTVGIGQEEKEEYGAELVEWDKAWKEAEVVVNNDDSIDSRTGDLKKVVFDKTVEIATKHGVSPEFILKMRNAPQMVTRQSRIIPKVAEAGAAYCSRLAVKARKLERAQVTVAKDRKKRSVTEPLEAEAFHSYLRTMKKKHPEMTVLEMCVEVDRLPANAKTPPRNSWQAKSQSTTWVGNYDHPKTQSSVKNFYSTVLRGNTPG